MADSFGTFAVRQFTVQLDSLFIGEILLLEFQLRGQVEQAQFLLFFRDHFIEEGQMVAEENDGGGIIDLGIFSDVTLEEDGGHGGDVLVAEAQVGAGEAGVSGLDRRDSYGVGSRAALGWTGDGARPYMVRLS